MRWSFLRRLSADAIFALYLAKMTTSASSSPPPLPSPLIPPPPKGYDENHWTLISQGAEARLWLINNYLTIVSGTSSGGTSSSRAAICKERFAKSYRHPTLDVRLTKSRTKAEARCLTRCRKAGVRCPAVLGVELAVPTVTGTGTLTPGSSTIISAGSGNVDDNTNLGGTDDSANSNTTSNRNASAATSSCIYLEHIDGCTVREYLEKRAGSGVMPSAEDDADFAPDRDSDDEKQDSKGGDGRQDGSNKRPKLVPSGSTSSSSGGTSNTNSKTKMTRVDDEAMKVAREVGILVADMHNSNIVHGDLTTSECLVY